MPSIRPLKKLTDDLPLLLVSVSLLLFSHGGQQTDQDLCVPHSALARYSGIIASSIVIVMIRHFQTQSRLAPQCLS
jgi:hypothetical protein